MPRTAAWSGSAKRRIGGIAFSLLALLSLGGSCGCSSLPARDEAAASAAGGRVTVLGTAGPVNASQESRTLRGVAAEGQKDLLALHLQVLSTSGDVDLYRGNRTRLLVDGPATFGAMKAAIARARVRVLLESYIVEDGGVAAEIAELLLQRAAAGVKVALVVDAVGSISTPDAFFKRLSDGGVAVCVFNPLSPMLRPGYGGLSRINHRDHRKLLVVDDEVAYTGGINISRVYGSGSSQSSSKGSGPGSSSQRRESSELLTDGWRDTQIELRGPVVPALSKLFAQTWHSQGCVGELGQPAPRTTAAEPGQRIVKIIASDPRDETNRIYTALMAAVDQSQRSVRVTMAYFAPGSEFVQALCDAALRGVRVELVLPGRSDSTLTLHAGRSYYSRMLQAGVQIYEMEYAVMHAKTAVIDGVFSTVGSSNLDWRSFVANNELNVIVLGEDFGAELAALFERDRAASRPVTPQAWSERGLQQRTLEQLGRLAERWL